MSNGVFGPRADYPEPGPNEGSYLPHVVIYILEDHEILKVLLVSLSHFPSQVLTYRIIGRSKVTILIQ